MVQCPKCRSGNVVKATFDAKAKNVLLSLGLVASMRDDDENYQCHDCGETFKLTKTY